MGKSKATNSKGSRKPLPEDPELLRAMLCAVNDFIGRFRHEFAEDSLRACLGLEILLKGIHGTPPGPYSTPSIEVKPEFFAAAKYMDIDALVDQLADLQSAIQSARTNPNGRLERAPLYLDRADEIRHNESQQHVSETKSSIDAYFTRLIELFLQIRTSLAMALTEIGPWSRPRSPDEWSPIFQRSWDTLKVYFEDQEIRNKKLSSKLYRVLLADLPSDYRD